MSKPRLLDLFCGAGGAAVGYHRAGFDVIGVDINPQPNYPFRFIQEDALRFMDMGQFQGFDAIHASPPCQRNVKGLAVVNERLGRISRHEQLIVPTRARLAAAALPYVIENVIGAELIDPVRLCGSTFGLPIHRHRLFESNTHLVVPPCNHRWQNKPRYWTSWRPNGEKRLAKVVQVYGNAGDSSQWPEAMGIDWMTRNELREAIPPAYSEFLGRQFIRSLEVAA